MLLCLGIRSQTRIIKGLILDSASRAPLQYVSIVELNKKTGTLSNSSGHFKIAIDSGTSQLEITTTGYEPYYLEITDTSTHLQTVLLSRSFTELSEVVVNARKGRYRNKGNPAVELIRRVIANKSKNGPDAPDYSSYKEYEKARILFDKPPKLITKNFLTRKFSFVFDNIDSTMIPGKKLFPVYQEEMVSKNYYRKQPEKKKRLCSQEKKQTWGNTSI